VQSEGQTEDLRASGGQLRRAEPAPTRGEITQFYEGTNQIQRLVIARPVQRLAATGRARYVPDAAVTDGVQREARGTPSVTPRRWPRLVIPGQDHSCSVAGRGFEPGRHQPTDLQSAARAILGEVHTPEPVRAPITTDPWSAGCDGVHAEVGRAAIR